ncbi:Beta-glucosidase 12 [Euphorbia peplus]|nr:Beta-glucosidase 12 [Euphorbia peplus]
MATSTLLFILLLPVLGILFNTTRAAAYNNRDPVFFNRSSFPSGFLFGTASAAYQYEGAAKEDGRGPSIWDSFTHQFPEKIADHSNGNVALDFYHRYKEDVRIMKEMGLDAFRFSISWPRILPKGKLNGGVNKEGIRYYNNLINELLANGIKPFITLFHWDLPQPLQDEYGGFLSPKIIGDFEVYAELCFKTFGDRVKHWITMNHGGDSSIEPYIAAHNQLLAHAAAVKLYKHKFQKNQKGVIEITLISHWYVPFSNTKQDKHAAKRSLDFMFGWFMDPITYGDYPKTLRSLVGKRLPKFSKKQSQMLKGSMDFLGLNYYTANYAASMHNSSASGHLSILTDSRVIKSTERNGNPIGPEAASPWLYVYPRGIRDLILYIKKKFNCNPLIYITENGVDEYNNATLTLEEQLKDNMRVDYYYRHLFFLKKVMGKDGANMQGYFAWSLLDNFKWNSSYTLRFGINYVDYKNGFKRLPKLFAQWFQKFLHK